MSKEDSSAPASIMHRKYQVLSGDVDHFRRMRMSRLFSLLQEVSIEHTIQLGYPKETTLDRGLLWVISRMHLRCNRPVLYDETIQITTWPGEMMHMIYPRNYRITDPKGNIIAEGSALWVLIDSNSRHFAMPADSGVIIAGADLADALPLPEALPGPDRDSDTLEATIRSVRYSDIDLNGHVNNTRYLDWIDDLYESDWHQSNYIAEIQVNFLQEIPPEAIIVIEKSSADEVFHTAGYISGSDQPAFQAAGAIRDAIQSSL